MAITALTMTADKEEVIDFVAPYFEQTGISIGKPSFPFLDAVSGGFKCFSDAEAGPEDFLIQVHDRPKTGSMAKHCWSTCRNRLHDLVPGQVLPIQRQE